MAEMGDQIWGMGVDASRRLPHATAEEVEARLDRQLARLPSLVAIS